MNRSKGAQAYAGEHGEAQLGITQDSVSRLEKRSDLLLSTLRKTVVLAGIAEDGPRR